MSLQDFQLPASGDCQFTPLTAENAAQWDEVIARQPQQAVGYQRVLADYQHHYFSTAFPLYRQLDCLLMWGQQVVGLWPLAVYGQADTLTVSSNLNGARGIVPPLLIPGLSEKQEKAISRAWLQALGALANDLGAAAQSNLRVASTGPWLSAPHWYNQLLLQGASLVARHRIVADLTLSEADYHKQLRKSYKALINNASKLWETTLDDRGDANLFAEFQTLHEQVAGRKTRPQETWDQQFAAIATGAAFAVYLHDSGGRLIGASLYNCSRDEVYYAVGAYDRALFDQPVAHLSIHEAITHARSSGRKTLILGDRPFPGDKPAPNDKEAKIAFFKEGFATALQLLPSLDIAAASLQAEAKLAAGESA